MAEMACLCLDRSRNCVPMRQEAYLADHVHRKSANSLFGGCMKSTKLFLLFCLLFCGLWTFAQTSNSANAGSPARTPPAQLSLPGAGNPTTAAQPGTTV